MKLDKLASALATLEQIDFPVFHHFSDGIYAREVLMPAGSCGVGAKHLTNHFFMIVEGVCEISTGGSAKRYEAPYLMETKKGMQRAITAITDTRIMTFHVTDKTDVKDIGLEITEHSKLLPQWLKLEGDL